VLNVDSLGFLVEEGLSNLVDLGLENLFVDNGLNLLDSLLSDLLMDSDGLLDDLSGKNDLLDDGGNGLVG